MSYSCQTTAACCLICAMLVSSCFKVLIPAFSVHIVCMLCISTHINYISSLDHGYWLLKTWSNSPKYISKQGNYTLRMTANSNSVEIFGSGFPAALIILTISQITFYDWCKEKVHIFYVICHFLREALHFYMYYYMSFLPLFEFPLTRSSSI